MTYDEKQILVETPKRLERLEKRIDAMCGLFSILLERKAGRPSAADVAELEKLKAEMNGAHH